MPQTTFASKLLGEAYACVMQWAQPVLPPFQANIGWNPLVKV